MRFRPPALASSYPCRKASASLRAGPIRAGARSATNSTETIDFQEKKIVRSVGRPRPLKPPWHEVIQRETLFLQTFAGLGKHVDHFSSPVEDFMREIDMNVALETRRIVGDGLPRRSVRRFLT